MVRKWWNERSHEFELFVSIFSTQEVGMGDEKVSKERLDLIKDIPLLPHNDEIDKIANEYIRCLQLPPDAVLDAFHLAVSSYYKIDFLLTWNLTHIANRILVRKFEEKNRELNLFSPLICTPEELLYY